MKIVAPNYILKGSFYLCVLLLFSCKNGESNELPYFGRHELVDGIEVKHKIRDFSFIDQDSLVFDKAAIGDRIHIADFFFTSCPSICPKVMQQMLRLQERYKNDDRVLLVSYTLDPKRDTPARLKSFGTKVGADFSMWKFVHGEKDSIMALANEDYYVPAFEDPEAPGGFDHSGKLLLIDTDGHFRAFAEGTEPESVTAFFDKIDILLSQMK